MNFSRMRRGRTVGVLSIVFSCLASSQVSAREAKAIATENGEVSDTDEVPQEAAKLDSVDRNWAITGGLSAWGADGFAFGGHHSNWAPGASVSLEYAITDRIWLMGRVGGEYSARQGSSYGGAGEWYQQTRFLHGEVGARAMLLPKGRVHLSAYALVGMNLGYRDTEESFVGHYTEFRSRDLGGRVGFMLGYNITDQLALGVSSDVVQAGQRQGVMHYYEHDIQFESTFSPIGYAEFIARPELQVRLAFYLTEREARSRSATQYSETIGGGNPAQAPGKKLNEHS